jgi:hypothetical protein
VEATDFAGNTITLVRTGYFIDQTGPILTLNGSGEETINVFTTWVDAGANWTDNYDGTGTILATSGSVNTGVVGTYTLEYTKADAQGNTGNTVVRTVHVVDTTPPVITLFGASTQYITLGAPYLEL